MFRQLLLIFLLITISSAYSRFGSNKVAEKHATGATQSINDQMMNGSPLRFYGRFRDGSNDVLNRYFNRL